MHRALTSTKGDQVTRPAAGQREFDATISGKRWLTARRDHPPYLTRRDGGRYYLQIRLGKPAEAARAMVRSSFRAREPVRHPCEM